MKKIEAVIRPFKLNDVTEALGDIGVKGMHVTEVRGFGRQIGQAEIYRGSQYTPEFIPKLLVVLVVPDDQAAQVVETIIKTAKTGKIGDGKVFVSSIEEAYRIRTGEVYPLS